MRNLPLALSRVWELYPSTGRKVTVGACCFRQVDLGTPEAVMQGVRDTQYQQATPLDCHTGFLSVSPAAACQGESLKPLEKFTIWRNRRHEENDFICCRNICRKCGRCNCNVHFTGEQKISEGERKWQVLI